MLQTETKREKINDFGDKIGGAKKDLSSNLLTRLSLITDDTLTVQPLSKVFPRPDFRKLNEAGHITGDTAIRLSYLYKSIPNKPRSGARSILRWIEKVKPVIEYIRQGLENEDIVSILSFLDTDENFINYKREMAAANWPDEDYNPHPFRIIFPHRFSSTKEIIVAKGRYIKFKSYNLDECIKWIRDNTGSGKKPGRMEFSVWRKNDESRYITPKGKKGIVLKTFPNRDEAWAFMENNHEELVRIYNDLRNIHQGRRDWNRPREGHNYRNSSDMTVELFSAMFPFRGVEFGNWVNQIERAAILNEAYDAFCDLASVLNVSTTAITLDKTLAAAFGARGSGNASAHYERIYKVFNLTRKKGAGSMAHEWFHALDNYIMALQGSPLSMATESPVDVQDSELSQAFKDLVRAIAKTDYKTRSEKIDEYKSKKYWGTDIELTARAFETYVIRKLKEQGYFNDYLANVMTYDEYVAKDTYPYPTDLEMYVLTPFYDRLMQSIFKNQKPVISPQIGLGKLYNNSNSIPK